MGRMSKAAGDRAQPLSPPAKSLELSILREKESVEDEEQRRTAVTFALERQMIASVETRQTGMSLEIGQPIYLY